MIQSKSLHLSKKVKPILIITNTYDPHVDFLIIHYLTPQKIPFIRFNTDEYPDPTSLFITIGNKGKFETLLKEDGRMISEDNIGGVWWRRPEPYKATAVDERFKDFARQEMKMTVEGWWATLTSHKWINDPFANRKADFKVYQMYIAREVGLNLPPTCITTDRNEFLKFWEEHKGEVIYKT